ncbi:MAG: CinA family protein [Promethearchaeia archaeon]
MTVLDGIERIIEQFSQQNLTIAFAESCTGGFLSHMITNVSGSSMVFDRGVVSYSNQAKMEILNVNSESIEKNGAVSRSVAYQMANNIRDLSHVNIGIGVTGIAGPTGGTPEKPVGLVFIGFSTQIKNDINTFVDRYVFKTSRIGFKKKVLRKVLSFLEEFIS